MYEVSADIAAGLVRAKLSGFFDETEVAAFSQAEQAAAHAVTRERGSFNLLIDTPSGIAQAAHVLGAFQGLIQRSPLKARFIVIVASSALLRLQLRRVIVSDRVGIYETLSEAENWLLAKEAAPAL